MPKESNSYFRRTIKEVKLIIETLNFIFTCFLVIIATILFHEIGHLIILRAFNIPIKIKFNKGSISLSDNDYLKDLPPQHLLLIYITGIFLGALTVVAFAHLTYLFIYPFNIIYSLFIITWFISYWFFGCKSDWKNIGLCLNTKK